MILELCCDAGAMLSLGSKSRRLWNDSFFYRLRIVCSLNVELPSHNEGLVYYRIILEIFDLILRSKMVNFQF